MSHKYEITQDKLDKIVTKHVELMKTVGFIPNLVVGVSLGGSIIGTIFAKKIGCEFQIDYRKNRRSYGSRAIQIKPNHLKILIVEDIADSMQSVFCSTKDILKGVYGEYVETTFNNWLTREKAQSKQEYKNKLMQQFPRYRIEWFALIYDPKQSQIYPDYSEYVADIGELSEEWKIPKPETKSLYKGDFPWVAEVVTLFDNELLINEVKNMPEFYSKCPFSDEQIAENKERDIASFTIRLKLFLGDEQVTKQTFLNTCEKEGATRYEWADGFYTEYNGEYYYFDVEESGGYIILKSGEQSQYRSFGERIGLMCADCTIKPTSEKSYPFCVPCNHYVRTIEMLHKILKRFRVIDCNGEITLDNQVKLTLEKNDILEDLGKLEEKKGDVI